MTSSTDCCATCAHFDPQPAPSPWVIAEACSEFERTHVPCQLAVDCYGTLEQWHWIRVTSRCGCGQYLSANGDNLLWLANPERHPDHSAPDRQPKVRT